MLYLVTSALSLNVHSALRTSTSMRASGASMVASLESAKVYDPTRASLLAPTPVGMSSPVVPSAASIAFKAAVDSPSVTAITEKEVLACQANWANAIASISKVYLEGGDYVGAAGAAAGELYGYGHSNVLFKPTKATNNPFRATGEDAMSYFVGAEAMDNAKFKGEDAGFAINGGKGWSKVVFTNHQVDLNGPVALAMGSYDFTCATTGDVATVEYTFGYKRNEDGKPRIFLHHSSVPYSP